MAWVKIVNDEGIELTIPQGVYDNYYKDNCMFTIKEEKKKAEDINESISKPSSNIKTEKESVANAKVNNEIARDIARKNPKKD